jgi:hypothetical protein
LHTSTETGRPGKVGFVSDGHSFQHIWQSGTGFHHLEKCLTGNQARHKARVAHQ